ncbi:MAG: DUF2333 family protein [Kiritimatiellae bacterium]|jgi:hypothetical protein|nr:DUF2333 family protein [Kiritimatiellia bacterium]
MNNFAHDDDLPEEDVEDVKAPAGSVPVESAEPEADEPNPTSFFRKKAVRMPLRIGTGLLMIGTAISIYWSLFPATFNVDEVARERAALYEHREPDQPLPRGYRTTSVIIHLADQLFTKPGGYLANDWNPMSKIPDNMRNWEYGYVTQLRIMVQGLRYELSRSGPQSEEHESLRMAESKFNFTHDSLVLPSTESQYQEGIRLLETYLDDLNSAKSEARFFAARQDMVIRWLERQKVMLGNYTAQLQRNVGPSTYDVGVLTEDVLSMEPFLDAAKEDQDEVHGFFERDDVFYQVRGGAYVMYHVMLAMRTDCEDLFNSSKAMGIVNRVLNELENANNPMRSPMVLNGKEFGFMQNHSMVMAAHLAKAHLAIQELQLQISGGGN